MVSLLKFSKTIRHCKTVFDLPIEKKLEIDFKNSKCLRGYEPMAAQTLDEGSPPDLKKGSCQEKSRFKSPICPKGYPQHGQNQWPEDLPEMKTQTETYIQQTLKLGKHLAGLLALSLGLEETTSRQAMMKLSLLPVCFTILLNLKNCKQSARVRCAH